MNTTPADGDEDRRPDDAGVTQARRGSSRRAPSDWRRRIDAGQRIAGVASPVGCPGTKTRTPKSTRNGIAGVRLSWIGSSHGMVVAPLRQERVEHGDEHAEAEAADAAPRAG